MTFDRVAFGYNGHTQDIPILNTIGLFAEMLTSGMTKTVCVMTLLMDEIGASWKLPR